MSDTRELEKDLREGLAHVTKGPWIKSGVRTTFRAEEKATWIGPDGYSIIAVMFSDRTPDDYRASMADAKWVFLAQPENIAKLLDALATERAAREKAEAESTTAKRSTASMSPAPRSNRQGRACDMTRPREFEDAKEAT